MDPNKRKIFKSNNHLKKDKIIKNLYFKRNQKNKQT
jgi:hypothetical protein